MSPVELLALLAAAIVILKLGIAWRSQRFWFNAVTTRYWGGSGALTMVLSFIASCVALMVLLQELTIVQVWAAMFFAMALISMALAPFAKYMLEAERKWFSEENVMRTGWLAAVVWTALSVWVLASLIWEKAGP